MVVGYRSSLKIESIGGKIRIRIPIFKALSKRVEWVGGRLGPKRGNAPQQRP